MRNILWSKWIGPLYLTYCRIGKGPTVGWSVSWVRPRRERQFMYGSHVVDRDQ
jgi:hypothetical protein